MKNKSVLLDLDLHNQIAKAPGGVMIIAIEPNVVLHVAVYGEVWRQVSADWRERSGWRILWNADDCRYVVRVIDEDDIIRHEIRTTVRTNPADAGYLKARELASEWIVPLDNIQRDMKLRVGWL